MKIVIDLYKPDYDAWIKEEDTIPYKLIDALKNGKVLPEHHGRLIDADKLPYEDIESIDGNTYMCVNAYDIEHAPTIVEANKGVLEKINEKQDSLRATCKAWDEALEKDGYVN